MDRNGVVKRPLLIWSFAFGDCIITCIWPLTFTDLLFLVTLDRDQYRVCSWKKLGIIIKLSTLMDIMLVHGTRFWRGLLILSLTSAFLEMPTKFCYPTNVFLGCN